MFFPKKLTASSLSLFMVFFKYRAIAKVKKSNQKKKIFAWRWDESLEHAYDHGNFTIN